MRKLLILLTLMVFSRGTIAQQSIIKAPRDSSGAILYAGLGLPYLIQPTIAVTAYDTSNRTALSTTGADTKRQFRHLSIYNPNASIGIYVCVGDSTGCSSDMWYAPPSLGVVDDYAYFGQGNNITHVYYRLSSAGSVVPTIRWW